ncbi:hypothetical protein H0H92_009908 [Tricholoma furcatifolium]|nr:hypothetical protein H0H92_009908 [Tricholoma furcatifolium]
MSESQSASNSDNTGPHLIRITDNGKIKAWVSFALNFLELTLTPNKTNEDRPLVFHTMPANPKPPTSADAASKEKETESTSASTSKLSKATTTVPRLLTVVEIIKREFIKSLESQRSPRLAGLHQYNEICLFESLGPECEDAENEETRATEIRRALSGVNHVRMKQTPYMKITLSLSALPDLAEKGATYVFFLSLGSWILIGLWTNDVPFPTYRYQPPKIRKLTKSAKLRMKKRERAAKNAGDAGDERESL